MWTSSATRLPKKQAELLLVHPLGLAQPATE
jgi:hypothetical protein